MIAPIIPTSPAPAADKPAFIPDCYFQGSASYSRATPARFLSETKTTVKVETEKGDIRTFQKPKECNGSYPSVEAIREMHKADRWRGALDERGNSADRFNTIRLYFDLEAEMKRAAEKAAQTERDNRARGLAEQIHALIYPAMKERYYHPDEAEISRMESAIKVLERFAE
jgi:hypothetical protein